MLRAATTVRTVAAKKKSGKGNARCCLNICCRHLETALDNAMAMSFNAMAKLLRISQDSGILSQGLVLMLSHCPLS